MRGWLRDADDVFLHLLVKPADGMDYRQMEVLDYRSGGGHLFGFIGALGLAEFRCGAADVASKLNGGVSKHFASPSEWFT